MRSLLFVLALLAVAGCRTTAPPAPPEPPKPVTVPDETPEEPPLPAPDAGLVAKPSPPGVPPGTYESQSHYPQTGVTEWVLTNGARVGFKPTPYEPRRLRMLVSTPDGMRAAPDSLAAAVLGQTVASGGYAARITEDAAELAGVASTEALEAWLHGAAAWLADPPPAPDEDAGVTVDEALSLLLDGKPFSTEGAADGAPRPFAWAFDDPRRLLVVIVGDASPTEVERSASVFARLRPSLQAVLEEDSLVAAPGIPRRAVELTLPGRAPGAAVGFRGQVTADFDALAGLDVLARVLAEAVQDRTGLDVRVQSALDSPSGVAEIRLSVEGRGVDAERFRRDVLREVRALRARAPSTRAMARARAQVREAHEAALATNEGWVDWLTRLLRNDQDTREAPAYGRRLSGVPAARLHALAQVVLDPDRYVFVARRAD